jgi:hypothetical protein
MTVQETNKIDVTAIDKNVSHVLLVIADHLDWAKADEGEHLLLLQKKLNAYLHFIQSGQLVEHYPKAKGLPIIIRIAGKYPLSAEAMRFFDMAKDFVENEGYSLEFKLPSSD